MFEKPASLISGNSKPVMDVPKSQSVQQLIQASERRERGDTGKNRVSNTYIFRHSPIPRLSICSMNWGQCHLKGLSLSLLSHTVQKNR